ncbi:MAG: hypothetical protein FJZ09_00905 [Candidatus Omnitrophica bacterium]|nr:hypothetical protein [Candidatus Omnitrophota bacterium]
MSDYLAYILFKAVASCVRLFPPEFSLFLGRRLGDAMYYLDARHRAVAYANIRTAFGTGLSAQEACRLIRKFYRNLGQSLIEIFFIPFVDKKYFEKYITVEGRHYIEEAFKKKRGVIFLGAHAGSWELSNVICANLGFPFNLLVRDQKKFPRLERLLNSYRSLKGCNLIQRQNQTRELIAALKKNEAVGMTVDQGGKTGTLVDFFGRPASMATGAIRLALKYDSVILPAYYTRIRGPYIKTIIEEPFEVQRSADQEEDVRQNLKRLMPVFEKNIRRFPADYLWTYKVWKYSANKRILILSDGKAGHLRQAEGCAKLSQSALRDMGIRCEIETAKVDFKNGFAKSAMALSSCLAGRYACQGCLWCLKAFLEKESYENLAAKNPDLVISCGAALAPVNFVLSAQSQARSVALMRPSVLSTRRFDLVIMPRHDRPPRRKNVIVTEGALNPVDGEYLKEESQKLRSAARYEPKAVSIGLLIGGDTKGFILKKETVAAVIRQVKSAAERISSDILVTTSRRTSPEIEALVKMEFKGYPRTGLLVIANEKNIPGAAGGIIGLSSFVVCSPESISMVSEAAASGKYVLVFRAEGLSLKHTRFLGHFAANHYIYLTEGSALGGKIEGIWQSRPEAKSPDDGLLVKEAVKRIF